MTGNDMDVINIDNAEVDLQKEKAFQDWLSRLTTFVEERVQPESRWRMYAYERGHATYLALDMFGKDRSKNMAITICITPDHAELPEKFDSEIVVSLPGMVEVLMMAGHLIGGACEQTGELRLMPWSNETMRDQVQGADSKPIAIKATKADVVLTKHGYKQQPLTTNMLLALHHLLAGRKDQKYRDFFAGCWGLRNRGLITDKYDVTEIGKKVATEHASVMAQFEAMEKSGQAYPRNRLAQL